ncbi:MAG: hypothetical protein QW331_04590 [Candidatus Woesearchaeota archaeon]
MVEQNDYRANVRKVIQNARRNQEHSIGEKRVYNAILYNALNAIDLEAGRVVTSHSEEQARKIAHNVTKALVEKAKAGKDLNPDQIRAYLGFFYGVSEHDIINALISYRHNIEAGATNLIQEMVQRSSQVRISGLAEMYKDQKLAEIYAPLLAEELGVKEHVRKGLTYRDITDLIGRAARKHPAKDGSVKLDLEDLVGFEGLAVEEPQKVN